MTVGIHAFRHCEERLSGFLDGDNFAKRLKRYTVSHLTKPSAQNGQTSQIASGSFLST